MVEKAPAILEVDEPTPDLAKGAELRRELDLLSEQEVADALGHGSTRTLQSWRQNGTGPDYIRLGKTIWYGREDLRRWIENNRVLRDLRAPAGRRRA